MRQLLLIAIFGVTLIVVIRLAVCFPDSLLARVLFLRIGPAPARGEARATYLGRCARSYAGWFVQAGGLFVVGWIALSVNGTLADSLYFLTFWAVVIPTLGAGALLAALVALVRGLWARRTAAGTEATHATRA